MHVLGAQLSRLNETGLLSTHIICLGAQKSRLSETVLLIIHNMYFGFVNLKMILHKAFLLLF